MTAFEIWTRLGEVQLQLDRTQVRINTLKHGMAVNGNLSPDNLSKLIRLSDAMKLTKEIRK